MRRQFIRRGAIVCAIWTLLLAIIAGFQYAFRASSIGQEHDIWWGFGVGIMVIVTAAVFLGPRKVPARTAPPHRGGQTSNGAAAPAFAAACLFAGMAWVWGIFLVYFSLPLVVFCVARWRVEWAERRQEEGIR